MSAKKVREKGQSKDTDKLIRRLSLVALLLSRRGRPVAVAEIRSKVEGYPTMTEEAFKRRFFEDRDELRRLGIEIQASEDPAVRDFLRAVQPAGGRLLPRAGRAGRRRGGGPGRLPRRPRGPVRRTPSRSGWRCSASRKGVPELLAEAEAPPLTVVPESQEPTAALPKLQAAVAERKTVEFEYYAITRDETITRVVDPYGLQLVAGEWYLIGWCHLREDLRTFRLSRVRSGVKYHTRRPHDFAPPDDFDLDAYRDRPAWQLAAPRATARVRVSPAMAWWVEAHWAHCGAVERLDDGSIVYETPYADARPLLGWVLGLADEAELLEPPDLRERVRRQLDQLAELLDAPAPERPARTTIATPPRPRRRKADPDLRVEVDRFTRLTALASYLMQSCDQDEAVLDVTEVRADLGVTARQLREDVGLLNLVNFGGDGLLLWAEFEGRNKLSVSCESAGPALARPARLSPLQADTLLLAIELVGHHLPTTTGAALESAAGKIRAARGGAPALAGSDLLLPADQILRDVNRAIVERRLLAIQYWTEGTDRVKDRLVEPYLLVHSRGEWYYVCWCRTAGGTRVFRVATTKRAELLEETFEPRADVELDLYRREGIPASGSYAPAAATVWYSPVVARWIAERQPVELLPDGSCLANQPYVDVRWLAAHLLRFADQARPIEPAEAVDGVRDVVRRLREAYV